MLVLSMHILVSRYEDRWTRTYGPGRVYSRRDRPLRPVVAGSHNPGVDAPPWNCGLSETHRHGIAAEDALCWY
jgi:hypothetical protein